MSDESPPLHDRTALVTGGSRGIGLATAQALRAAGARVAILGRSRDALDAACRAIGSDCLPLQGDVSNPEDVRRMFGELARELGRLDILVNNAAIGRLHRVEEASDADIQAGVGTNLLGPIYCVRAAVPLMRANGGGQIVNISSESVVRPFPYLTIYAATKGALETFSLALRAELQPDGIRVTLFRSGAAATPGFAREWEPERAREVFEVWKERGLLDYAGTPMPTEVIARSIVHAVTRPAGASVDFFELRSS